MTKLLILRGVPGSGKSTYALALPGYVRVNRDDIRFALFGRYWDVDERLVTDVEIAAVRSALSRGDDVVLDATNLNRRSLMPKLGVAAETGATVEYMDFPVTPEVAIARDAARDRSVGEGVIVGFFKRNKIDRQTGELPAPPEPYPAFEPYRPTEKTQYAYIFDTDGTVADHEGVRSPYDTGKYAQDNPKRGVVALAQALKSLGYAILGVSGRSEDFREVTLDWWAQHALTPDEFFMRPSGDTRNDAIVKYDLFNAHIRDSRYHVMGVFDDRPRVLRMWRALGIETFQIGTGEEF